MMMLTFWPHALLEDGRSISTTDPTCDYKQAEGQFSAWERNLGPIERAIIDVVDEDNNIHRVFYRKEWMQIPNKEGIKIV